MNRSSRAGWISPVVLPAVTDGSLSQEQGPEKKESSMLYSVDTEKSLSKLREDLPKACSARKFGVMSVIDLKEKMKEKGVEYGGECLIFEVCNPEKARQTLEANPEISTALPCRISAFKTKEGKTRLSTIRPSKLIDLFGTPELQQLAGEVEDAIKAIMNASAR